MSGSCGLGWVWWLSWIGLDWIVFLDTQDQTRALLLAEWDQFTTQVQNGNSLLAKINHQNKELVELEAIMDGEVSYKPPSDKAPTPTWPAQAGSNSSPIS